MVERTERFNARVTPAEMQLLDAARSVLQAMRGLRAVPSRTDVLVAGAAVLAKGALERKVRVSLEVRKAVQKAVQEVASERAGMVTKIPYTIVPVASQGKHG